MTLTLPIRIDPTSPPDETLHVTASGLPVLIYNINGGGNYPIHGAIFKGEEWHPNSWKANGKHSFLIIHDFDLRDRPKAKRGWWVAVLERHQFARIFRSEEEAREKVAAMKSKLLAIHYLEEGDGLDTADPPLWVDWAELPGWAKWATADENGEVWVYSERPSGTIHMRPGSGEKNMAIVDSNLYHLAPGFDWRDTLTQRPEGK